MIDGEIVVLDEKGISRFARVAGRAVARAQAASCVFYAFDLLHLDGWDLARGAAARSARRCSRSSGRRMTGRSAIQFSDHVDRRRARLLRAGRPSSGSKASSRSALERPTRPAGRKTWIKCKATLTGDFVIAGYTASGGGRRAGGAGARRVGGRRAATIAARSAPGSIGDAMADSRAPGSSRCAPERGARRSTGRRRTSSGCGRCCRREVALCAT